jgi:Zn ribbon nucleic-acid-binding protein
MIGLLRAAQCPACDGSGTIAIQRARYEYDSEQCQWCYERDLVLSHFDKVEEKECQKTENVPF